MSTIRQIIVKNGGVVDIILSNSVGNKKVILSDLFNKNEIFNMGALI